MPKSGAHEQHESAALMRRVVVTGLGVTSCLGVGCDAVRDSLYHGRSGIRHQAAYAEVGMRSCVAGNVEVDLAERIPRRRLRLMGPAAAYAHLAMEEALSDAGLALDQISDPRIGIIAGSGGASSSGQVEAVDVLRAKGLRRVGPYRVMHTMGSTVSACLASSFGLQGVNYSISSACATSAHCIGNAAEQIREGRQDMVFAGGGEEEHWSLSMMFDAMGALSSTYNEEPSRASRPYDAARDGFVIAGGAGMLVLEEAERALARGARVYAELVGYAATSDGSADMVAPTGEGAVRCMRQALSMADDDIDYINVHGTSTPVGDIQELNAIRRVFGDAVPPLSSTKSLSGHSLGAAGVHEAIYALLMMRDGFISASANIDDLDPGAAGMPIVTERMDEAPMRCVLSNSFGFGGTNACLVFRRV